MAGLDERAALWRELTARRRAIVVLDDAYDAAQVRPLLPGTHSCSVLVTSRHRLTDLEGSWSLSLEVPSPSEASALFTRVVGRARTTNSAALRRTVELCGYHPLALHLAAARLRHRIGWDIEDLADRLTRAASLLDEIDTSLGIATAFELCYAELDIGDRRLFRRLALHPGPDFTVGVAAALAGEEEGRTRRGLDTLLDGHLIEESGRDRFRTHDLIREFGLKTGDREDSPVVRQAAVRRMLDHYLLHADRADRLARPHRRRIGVPPSVPGPTAADPRLRTAEEGEAWLDLERANLLAAARTAVARSPDHALFFPHVLGPSFLAWGIWDTATDLYTASVDLAREGADDAVTGRLLAEMAALLWNQGAHDEALSVAEEAWAMGRDRDDQETQAQALIQIGRSRLIDGRRIDAFDCLGRALALHRATGNRGGEAYVQNLLGVALSHGQYAESVEQFRAMLATNTDIGDRLGQVKALNNIGEVFSILGRYEEARGHYVRSLALVRVIGGRQEMSNLFTNIGNIRRATGDFEGALSQYRRALNAYRDTSDPRGRRTCSSASARPTWRCPGTMKPGSTSRWPSTSRTGSATATRVNRHWSVRPTRNGPRGSSVRRWRRSRKRCAWPRRSTSRSPSDARWTGWARPWRPWRGQRRRGIASNALSPCTSNSASRTPRRCGEGWVPREPPDPSGSRRSLSEPAEPHEDLKLLIGRRGHATAHCGLHMQIAP